MNTQHPHWLRIWVDGGVLRQNPSPVGVYWSIRVERPGVEPVIIRKKSRKWRTNNDAEWLALREALQWVVSFGQRQPAMIYSDSQLIVNQFNGVNAVNYERLRQHRSACRDLVRRCRWVAVQWRPRSVMVEKLGH